jgi:hypothetical protein
MKKSIEDINKYNLKNENLMGRVVKNFKNKYYEIIKV